MTAPPDEDRGADQHQPVPDDRMDRLPVPPPVRRRQDPDEPRHPDQEPEADLEVRLLRVFRQHGNTRGRNDEGGTMNDEQGDQPPQALCSSFIVPPSSLVSPARTPPPRSCTGRPAPAPSAAP